MSQKTVELGMNVKLIITDTDYALTHWLDNSEAKRFQEIGFKLKPKRLEE